IMLPLWTKVKARTIIIQGKKDSLVPKENADFAARMITQAPVKITMVDDMGHFVPWTNPELIRNAVLELIEEFKGEKLSNEIRLIHSPPSTPRNAHGEIHTEK